MSATGVSKIFNLKNRAGKEIRTLVSLFDHSRFDEFYNLFRSAAENNDGFTAEEMTKEYLRKSLETHHYVSMVDEDSGELMAVNGIFPSAWSRAENPLTHATATVVDPKYRGYGMARVLYNLMDDETFGRQGRYLAGTGRGMMTSRNLVPVIEGGYLWSAVIPKCNTGPGGKGFVDNLLSFKKYNVKDRYPERYQEVMDFKNMHSLQLQINPDKSFTQNSSFIEKELKIDGETLKTHGINDWNEFVETENVLRQKADDGKTITLDEFDSNGLHNRRTFWSSEVVCIKDKTDSITAFAIYGPAKIIRIKELHISQVNVIVSNVKEHMTHGKELLNQCLEHCENAGYLGCVTDILTTDPETLGMYFDAGFIVMGTIPYTGITRQLGPTHAMLLYKEFKFDR